MAIIRVKHLDFETKYRVPDCADTLNTEEWAKEDANRVKEAGWQSRYEYEADLILHCIQNSPPKSILEIGPGPGVLSELIQNKLEHEVEYHLIDKQFAEEAFVGANRKGKFFVKDIADGLDTSGLNPYYDLVICNDTLEHLFNPSRIVQTVYNLLSAAGLFFISVPNWRMGHQFTYRGLFDYDNFLYFMAVHKFTSTSVYASPLQTPHYPKLDSEEEMDDELIRSWNWYFTFVPNNPTFSATS